jgi:drug/metabolite transporter (DMT)-like permease
MAVIFYGTGGRGALIGTALALYSAFCFSCYAVLLRWGQNTEMSVALIWNALFLIIICGLVIGTETGLREAAASSRFAISLWNLLIICIMGAIQLCLGLILFTVGSRSVPAAQLSLIALVEPALSPLWAWLVARELPPVWTFAGGAVILLAIVIQTLFAATSERRNARRQSRAA